MFTRYPEIHITKLHQSPDRKHDQFQLVRPFIYHHPLVGERVVPAGFVTDGLSVPQLFWGLIPPHGVGFAAAVIHDDCYINNVGAASWGHTMARQVADTLFRDNCRALGMPEWEVKLVYRLVRWGGSFNWNKFSKHSSLPLSSKDSRRGEVN